MSLRRFHRKKQRHIEVSLRDLPHQVDALFTGCDGEYLGQVVTKANPAGRRAIEDMFPGGNIAWREVDGPDKPIFPDGWCEFCFVIPTLPRECLPQHLLEVTPMDEWSPEQFATLMAMGVEKFGVRTAMFSAKNRDLLLFTGNVRYH